MSVKHSQQSENPLPLFGQLALRFRMISEAQLNSALTLYRKQKKSDEQLRFEQLLVAQKLISAEQLDFLVSAQKMKSIRIRDRRFGDIAIEYGYAREEQVMKALQEQKERFKQDNKATLIGDIMVDNGTLTADQKDSILLVQQEVDSAPAAATEPGGLLLDESGQQVPLKISVSADRLQASLRVYSYSDTDAMLRQVHEQVSALNISYGLKDDEAIIQYLSDEQNINEPFLIAGGEAPRPARDATVKYHFDTDPLKVGRMKEGGVIDFKDRGEIPQINAGDLLAELVPGEPGGEGVDIYGNTIAAPEPREALINCGDGVELSADASRATATISGTPNITKSGSLYVFPVYRVDGDIGYETGHVSFDGDIQVKEGVESDFNVTGGRLCAAEIRAATIEVKGDVVVIGGIIGARIKAGGNLKAWYIHKADIDVAGDVIVQQEVMESDVRAGGGFIGEKCTVLASRLAARQGVSVADVGSEAAAPSTLVVGTDEQLDVLIRQRAESLKDIQAEQQRLKAQIDNKQQRYEEINVEVAKLAQVQDRSQVGVRELQEKRAAVSAGGERLAEDDVAREIELLEQKGREAEAELAGLFEEQDGLDELTRRNEEQIAQKDAECEFLQQEMDELKRLKQEAEKKAVVKVYGAIYPLNQVTGTHASVKIKDVMKSVLFSEKYVKSETGGARWVISARSLK